MVPRVLKVGPHCNTTSASNIHSTTKKTIEQLAGNLLLDDMSSQDKEKDNECWTIDLSIVTPAADVHSKAKGERKSQQECLRV